MVMSFQGGGGVPGVIGSMAGTRWGQVPGVLGFKQEDLSKGKGVGTKAMRTASMPAPWKNFTPKRLGVVPWKLSKGEPQPGDIKQGGLANCPVAAILAALAHTPAGRKHLNDMVAEFDGVTIKTVLSPEIIAAVQETTSDDPDYKPQAREIVSHRYFTVKFWKGEIPDTFYIQYTDGADTIPVFMSSPHEVLWPLVIEKACALHYGSYKELGNYKEHTANEHWGLIVGRKPEGFDVSSSTNVEKIRAAAENAGRVPTIAASRPGASKVTPDHGFAVLGMAGSEIELYNPYGKTVRLSLEDFRDNFQTVLQGNP